MGDSKKYKEICVRTVFLTSRWIERFKLDEFTRDYVSVVLLRCKS